MRSFVAVLLVAVVAGSSVAGPFGLFRRGNGGGTQQTYNNGNVQNTQARGFGLWTAQDSANYQASLCRMFHAGNPTGGFEGVGMASTPEAALANTCKPHNGPPRDWGVARGANGFYYACRRW